MKKVAVLGSTGSIGRSALEVLASMSSEFEVFALSANENVELLSEQTGKFRPSVVSIGEESLRNRLSEKIPDGTKVVSGDAGLVGIASSPEVDIVVNGLSGSAGFLPTIEAVRAGKRIALANKETLVSFGSIVMDEARAAGAEILPVDSEHSAVHQAIGAHSRDEISRVILTASGGPFLNERSLDSITPKEALAHPTWDMGKKVTIDSATLMNKGLEVIEARWLFDIDPSRIEVVVHPQSILHSMVEFVDSSCIAQLAVPDMRLPIQYALTYPKRTVSLTEKLDLAEAGKLEFSRPDSERFPCLGMAYSAIRAGGTAPAVLSASDEIAVRAFLEGAIGFRQIPLVIGEVIRRHSVIARPSIEDLVEADDWARGESLRVVGLVEKGQLSR
jgi:1-deoxy-D-xylulose-5-phosphate reductoisomerase